jgi:hypothetical protein
MGIALSLYLSVMLPCPDVLSRKPALRDEFSLVRTDSMVLLMDYVESWTADKLLFLSLALSSLSLMPRSPLLNSPEPWRFGIISMLKLPN